MPSSDFSFAPLREVSTSTHKQEKVKSYDEEAATARAALNKGGKAIDAYVANASVNQLNLLWQLSEKAANAKVRAQWQTRIKSKLCKRILESSDPVINKIQMISKLEFKQAILDKIQQKAQKNRLIPLSQAQRRKLTALARELSLLKALDKMTAEDLCQFIIESQSKVDEEIRRKLVDTLVPKEPDLITTTTDPLTEKVRVSKALITIVSASREGKSVDELISSIIEYMKIHQLDPKYAEFISMHFQKRGELNEEQGKLLVTKIMQQLSPSV